MKVIFPKTQTYYSLFWEKKVSCEKKTHDFHFVNITINYD